MLLCLRLKIVLRSHVCVGRTATSTKVGLRMGSNETKREDVTGEAQYGTAQHARESNPTTLELSNQTLATGTGQPRS